MTTEKQHRIYPPLLARARELRHPQTPAESNLWLHLRSAQLGGLKFRRQHPIGRFIVDFYCAACRLVVEIDGDSHADQVEYDTARRVRRGAHRVAERMGLSRDPLFQSLGS